MPTERQIQIRDNKQSKFHADVVARLKAAIEDSGHSIKSLSEKQGIAQAGIYALFNGNQGVTIQRLFNTCNAAGIDLQITFGGDST